MRVSRRSEWRVLALETGILQRDPGLTEEDAYLTIQRQSRQRRTSKKEIAERSFEPFRQGSGYTIPGEFVVARGSR